MGMQAYERSLLGLASSTIRLYVLVANKLVEHGGGDLSCVDEITVHTYIQKMQQELSSNTVKTRLLALRKFVEWGVGEEIFPRQLLKAVPNKWKAPTPEPKVATPEEIDALLGYATRPHQRLIVLLAAHAGLRESELRGLRWEDIDFEQGTINVVGKGQKRRVIPFTTEQLENELHTQRQETGFVLPGQGGTMMCPSNIVQVLGRLCERANLRKLNPHALRHGWASAAHLNGVGTLAIQAVLGHAALGTTEHYLASLRSVPNLRQGLASIRQGFRPSAG